MIKKVLVEVVVMSSSNAVQMRRKLLKHSIGEMREGIINDRFKRA